MKKDRIHIPIRTVISAMVIGTILWIGIVGALITIYY